MLDRVEVSWCGSRACLNKAAHVSQVSALELMVRPFDPKLVGDIVAAIIADDAKLNVIPDGYDAWLLFLRGRIISFAT